MLDTDAITAQHFRRLHPIAIESHDEVREILERLRREKTVLRAGLNRQIDPKTAVIEEIDGDVMLLRTRDFDSDGRAYVFLEFAVDGVEHFFAARHLGARGRDRLRARVPRALYQVERRDRMRMSPLPQRGDTCRLLVKSAATGAVQGEIEDYSPAGLAIRLPARRAERLEDEFEVHFLDGARSGAAVRARVRHREPMGNRPGWTRLGLDLAPGESGDPVEIERRATILDEDRWQRARQRWKVLSQSARLATRRAGRVLERGRVQPVELRLVRYANAQGEEIVALIDACGDTRSAPAVIIPPAWGRTKETLLPLARTIVAAFAAAGRSVTVVRFDGVRKRGESHNDPECRAPGEEHRHFTCSQGVDDIRATLDFLHALPEFRPSKAVLVTFSASAVEGRRATLLEGGRRLHGWVSVVGSPDLQSAMRVISGGVDYVAGLERGIRFGIQEVLGVYVDIDRTGSDAVANGLAFLDDARRELAQIDVPIRWFAGEHDAWMDLDRTIDILSRGTTENRRIIIIPTGHQLRTSREALEAFQSIAGEIGRMTLGVDLPAALPDFVDLERRQRAERNRRRRSSVDLRGFWRDYLVGRDGSVGIELMVNTSAYREFMDAQIHALRLGVGERVADLGSGTGAFALQLCERTDVPKPLVVHEFDFVRQALDRARSRFAPIDRDDGIRVQRLEASLDVRTRQLCVPARASSYDAVLASLLLGYVSDPACLLREIRRVLRPGGRLVLSNLRRDADFSRIFREGLAELRQGLFGERFSESEVEGLDGAARSMLNAGARLLELEESGTFRFWDREELVTLVRRAGFRRVRADASYGDPPQVVVVSAERG